LLAKNYRLPSSLIPQVLKKGKRFYSKHFVLILDRQGSSVKNKEPSVSRFTFIVPLKFNKRAVKRNRLKRCLREKVGTSLAKIKWGYNAIFLARDSRWKILPSQINVELGELLRESSLLKA
jgi:ribonuclease P protein component